MFRPSSLFHFSRWGTRTGTAVLLGASCALGWQSVTAAQQLERNTRVVENIDAGERLQLQALQGFSVRSLDEIRAAFSADELEAMTRELASAGNAFIGARPVDDEGFGPVHQRIREQVRALGAHGVEELGALRFAAQAPVLLDETFLELPDGSRLDVVPLYPNGPMPALAPTGGLSGPLVDAGRGDWSDLNGVDLQDAVALLNFSGARNAERLFALGAIAVIVLEDDEVSQLNAEKLFQATPTPFPRFYANRAQAARLRDLAGQSGAARVTLRGGHVFAERPLRTLFVWLPPTAPITYEITGESLLNLIAEAYAVNPANLRQLNESNSTNPAAATEWKLPADKGTIALRPDTLPQLLARKFGVAVTALKQANPTHRFVPGETVLIPNRPGGMAVTVPVDTMSVAPNAPHGARTLSNVAVALQLMEWLATSTDAPRRTGLLFIFSDGDSLGGLASRTAAEYFLIAQNRWVSALEASGTNRLALYENGARFFEGDIANISSEAAYWLDNEWIISRIEEVRIGIAEERIERIVERRELADESAPEQKAVDEDIAALEETIQRIRDLKVSTLERVGATPKESLRGLYAYLEDPANAAFLEQFDLHLAALETRYRREWEQEASTRANHENNQNVARRVLAALNPEWQSDRNTYRWNYYLDLSTDTAALRLVYGGKELRAQSSLPDTVLDAQSARFREAAALAAQQGGWENPFPFVDLQDTAEFPLPEPRQPAFYEDFWRAGYLATAPLGTARDRYALVDTPHDTVDRIDFQNLERQAQVVGLLARLSLELPSDSYAPTLKQHAYSQLIGEVNQFNIRSGIDANDPVADALVYFPSLPKDAGFADPNSSSWRGFRRGVIVKSLLNGSYRLPLARFGYNLPDTRVYVYDLDRDLAVFTRVGNEGQVGTQIQQPKFQFKRDGFTEKRIVVSELQPRVIFPGTSPYDYEALGGSAYLSNVLRVEDAVLDGPPRNYAVDNPVSDFRELDSDAFVIYMPPERRFRAYMQSGLLYDFILSGPLDGDKGRGYAIGVTAQDRSQLYLPATPLRIAEDMQELASNRQAIYARYGVRSQVLEQALARSEAFLEAAHAAEADNQWQRTIGNSRESWGMLVKNYPRLLNLGRQAVFSVIFVMAFLVPAAFFCERLIIGARSIIGRLGGTALFFILGTAFLSFFHPAFKIALSPFIIVISFTMILMSLIVLGISYQRFEVLLRRHRIQSGEVESEEISLLSSLSTAFSLGISNLKKRTFRTVLTSFTVTALTFSIVAFVSVNEGSRLVPTELPLDNTVDGKVIEPLPPTYNGVLFRKFQWTKMEDSWVKAISAEFGDRFPVLPRAFYIETEGGNSADREGVNEIPVETNGERYIVTGVMAFVPEEKGVSQLPQAVTAGEWFRPGDRLHVILPDVAARELGIKPADLIDSTGNRLPDAALPTVRMKGVDWKVIGILDTDLADRMRDINGKSFAMVDFLRSGFSTATTGEIEHEGTAYHLNWEDLSIIPYASRDLVEAKPRAVAVAIEDPKAFDRFYTDFALRSKKTVFGHQDGEITLLSSREKVNLSGLTKILLPILLCVLIVMNTMLGTVEERQGEVKMLGAVGLSPRQIAFLLLSEATVFSVLGLVFGTFGGLGFANIIFWLNSQGTDVLSSLSFNFTSLLSSVLALMTGLIVLMATLIPARKAAALAAPSGMMKWTLPEPDESGRIRFRLPFTLSQGNALGMLYFFERFLERHSDSTNDEFIARSVTVRHTPAAGEEEESLALQSDVWLAPYDLDVSQRFEMRISPEGSETVFAVDLCLHRNSGSLDAWMRCNYRFIDLVRLQFLLWRNLPEETRTRYCRDGVALAAEALPGTQAPTPAH